MKNIIITLMLLVAGLASATTNHYPLTYDTDTGNTVYSTDGSNTNILASGLNNYFAPSFGSFKLIHDHLKYATSVVVTNGTITSGTISNTWACDQSYFRVQATGVFEVYYSFSNAPTLYPKLVRFTGFWDANSAREVDAYIYDYATNAYPATPIGTVLDSSEDYSQVWAIPSPSENYISSNGISTVKFLLDGSAVASHYFYTDCIAMEFADIIYTNAGVWYPFSGVTVLASNNIGMSASSATITTTSAGTYRNGWCMPFTGSTNTTFTVRQTTNGVATDIELWRRIGDASGIDSPSVFGYLTLAAGVTNGWESKCDESGGWLTIINGSAEVVKVSN